MFIRVVLLTTSPSSNPEPVRYNKCSYLDVWNNPHLHLHSLLFRIRGNNSQTGLYIQTSVSSCVFFPVTSYIILKQVHSHRGSSCSSAISHLFWSACRHLPICCSGIVSAEQKRKKGKKKKLRLQICVSTFSCREVFLKRFFMFAQSRAKKPHGATAAWHCRQHTSFFLFVCFVLSHF